MSESQEHQNHVEERLLVEERNFQDGAERGNTTRRQTSRRSNQNEACNTSTDESITLPKTEQGKEKEN